MPDVSITDIAKVAGVSPSTVSRALQDHPRISVERRVAIQALAQELGYRPSQVARSLATGQTHTLGVVVTDVTDAFVAEVMKGAEAASRSTGYSLLFATSNRDPEEEMQAAQLLLDRQVDGMVVVSSRASGRYAPLLEAMRRAGQVPVVLVNNHQPGPNVHSVSVDNRSGARDAVEFLGRLGHRRIAFVLGPEGGQSAQERLEGYRQGLKASELEDEILLPGSGYLGDGSRALAALLDLPQQPTAVFCYNDLSAIGLISAAHVAGLRIPAELSVVGYDNLPLSAFTVPPLTSVGQPTYEMGMLAVRMCLDALVGKPAPDVTLTGRLVVRNSTARPATAD